ncbi:Omega-6 fatty acid desaturase family protein [Dorcoceras hygrometricum]|uniref:Omega-6 fatty acid desaturase family protein n=1 Tax=Dorcoceras hygrometricum TaxID=472368 RepID=A0A2Z7CUG9_9LAMI|nr:Omega-6 fatty acid desaturase family protein [Dorcoceras hygrometricum]
MSCCARLLSEAVCCFMPELRAPDSYCPQTLTVHKTLSPPITRCRRRSLEQGYSFVVFRVISVEFSPRAVGEENRSRVQNSSEKKTTHEHKTARRRKHLTSVKQLGEGNSSGKFEQII